MDDFGGKLRQARERRGISLRQIAASTKIASAALEALERNDVSKLPGGIFSRAFIRSYAMEIGLDPEETVREFLQRFSHDPPPSAKAPGAPLPEQEREFEQRQARAAKTLAIVIAIPIVALILYFVLRRHSSARVPLQTPRSAGAAPASDSGTPSTVRQMQLDVHPTSTCWVSLTVGGQRVFARVVTPGEHESHTVQREAVLADAGAFAFLSDGRLANPRTTGGTS
jgi:cytoskeletal protein RodZ